MSRNGVGLKSTRGTGTSGYVTKSLSSIGDKLKYDRVQKKKTKEKEIEKLDLTKVFKVKEELKGEIYKHDELRKIEKECVELRDKLEDEEIPDLEIEQQVKELREKLINGLKSELKNTHVRSSLENDENRVLEGASDPVFKYKPLYENNRADEANRR